MRKKIFLTVIIVIFSWILSACAGQNEAKDKAQNQSFTFDTQETTTNISDKDVFDAQETETHEQETKDTEDVSVNGDNSVILRIHYFDGEVAEYTLSIEQTAFISDIFYVHEKTTVASPVDSVGTVELRIGKDVLSTSIGGLPMLDGIINQEYVTVELRESESQKLQDIISSYVSDLTLVP